MMKALLAALLSTLAASAWGAPLTVRFYEPGAILVDGSALRNPRSQPAGNVTFASQAVQRVRPNSRVEIVAFSDVLARRVAIDTKATKNRDAWRMLRGRLLFRGQDETGRFVYSRRRKAPAREGLFDVFVKARAEEKDARPRRRQGSAELEISCSNGIFCDGAERFVGGKCVPAHPDSLPCVYGEGDCYVHACLEDRSSCALEPIAVQRGEPCATCSAPSALRSSAAGVSAAALPSDGTCESPKPLFAAYNAEAGEESYVLKFAADGTSTSVKTTAANAPSSPVQVPVEGIRLRVVQKSTDGYQDVVRPTCSGGDGSRDVIYSFEVTAPFGQGFEIMMLGYVATSPQVFSPDSRDTLVAVHNDIADGCAPATPEDVVDQLCSDDSSLPGGTGSRVYGVLSPGKYTIVASFFNDRANGAFQLLVMFTDASSGPIRPVCTDRYCGLASAQVQGVQQDCGLKPYLGLPACTGVETCEAGRCSNCGAAGGAGYVSTCGAKSCGSDLCGLPCGQDEGSCPATQSSYNTSMCELRSGQCQTVPVCNYLAPECPPTPPDSQPGWWCGSDCTWYRPDAKLVDLVPGEEQEVYPTISYNTRDFFLGSCPIAEGCIGVPEGVGPTDNFQRKLMRFATFVHNIGADFKPPLPVSSRPDLFMWSDCHEHYHFNGFAGFTLLNLDETVALPGQKLAFCMLDSFRYLTGPAFSCAGESNCNNQGIQRGWTDVYSQDLDCQWLDVTEVPSDWYILRICVNFARTFQESTFENNCNRFPVWIPPSVGISVKRYGDLFNSGEESRALCQNLYDRTAGTLKMPLVCSGLYTA